jgi:hypothetical protein
VLYVIPARVRTYAQFMAGRHDDEQVQGYRSAFHVRRKRSLLGRYPHSQSLPPHRFYESYSELSPGGGISFLFYKLESAEAVHEYINSGVAMDQSGFSV